MKGKRLLIMMLAVMLGVTQVGMPVYGASSSDVLDGELGLEEWNECDFLYGGNHDIVVVKGKEPTATEPGWTEHSYCKRCEKVFVAKVDLPPVSDENPAPEEHEHKQVIDKAVTATVDRDGKTSGIHCSSCNTVIVAQKTIPRIDSIKLSATKLTYNGKNQSSEPVILDKTGKQLVEDTDYTVTYSTSDRTKTGHYKVTVTFKGQYSGSKELYFTIVPDATSTVSAELYGHDDVKVTWSKSTGASGYYVYYKKSSDGEYAYLTRTTGTSAKKADLTDGIQYTFKVVPYYKYEDTRYQSLTAKTATVYTLKKMAAPAAKWGDSSAVVSWPKLNGASGYHVEQYIKKDGEYSKVDGFYTISLSKSFTAAKGKYRYYRVRAYVKMDDVKKFAPWSEMTTLNADAHKHQAVTDKAVTATTSRDGKTAGSHCKVCGATITAQKTISRIDSIKLSATKLTYNGKNRSPYPVIMDQAGNKLVKDTDYSVTYGSSSRTKTGRYKVTVTFKGKYSGSKALYFTIVPKAPSTMAAKLYGYDDVKVSWSKSTGASGYYVYYKKSAASGYTYLTRTTGTSVKKADLTDGIQYTFKVVPYYKYGDTRYQGLTTKTATVYTLKKMAAPTVKNSESKAKVSWPKLNGASGYHVEQYKKVNGNYVKIDGIYTTSLSKNFTAAKGKTRYYRVRAYVKVDGVKKFALWSDMKSFKR